MQPARTAALRNRTPRPLSIASDSRSILVDNGTQHMSIQLAYVIFPFVALAIFRFARPATAALVVFLGGWLLLPVGNYPPGSDAVIFPYWITGLAVPSSMLLTKAWVAPAAALLGVMIFDRPALARPRYGWVDLPIALWCLWPMVQSFRGIAALPAGWLSSAYLLGCW